MTPILDAVDMSCVDDDAESAEFGLDAADVLTAGQADKLLDRFIKPLPGFDEGLLPR